MDKNTFLYVLKESVLFKI